MANLGGKHKTTTVADGAHSRVASAERSPRGEFLFGLLHACLCVGKIAHASAQSGHCARSMSGVPGVMGDFRFECGGSRRLCASCDGKVRYQKPPQECDWDVFQCESDQPRAVLLSARATLYAPQARYYTQAEDCHLLSPTPTVKYPREVVRARMRKALHLPGWAAVDGRPALSAISRIGDKARSLRHVLGLQVEEDMTEMLVGRKAPHGRRGANPFSSNHVWRRLWKWKDESRVVGGHAGARSLRLARSVSGSDRRSARVSLHQV